MHFKCSHAWEDGYCEEWIGQIVFFKNYGQFCEMKILSRSSLHLIFGKYSNGLFVVAPQYGGTNLSSRLNDIFYNTEKLSEVFGNTVDGVTAAKALATVSDIVVF